MKANEVISFVVMIGFIFGGWWLISHLFKKDIWTLTYISPMTGSSLSIGQYDTRGECQYKLDLAKQYPLRYSRPECGKNCEPSGLFDGYICEETFEL